MATTTGTRTAGSHGGAKKAAAKKSSAKSATKRAAAKPTAAKWGGSSHASDPSHYTDPALRDRLKDEILAGDKGGRPGQWSARKAQLLAHEYEAQGGGYVGDKTPAQQHLDQWTHEAWTTADGKPAIRGGTTARYLPKQAWEELTPAERRSTDKKKRAASNAGQQFVANTGPAAAARRDATTRATAKKTTAKRPAEKKRPSTRARP